MVFPPTGHGANFEFSFSAPVRAEPSPWDLVHNEIGPPRRVLLVHAHANVLIKIVFYAEPPPDIPQIYIRIKRTDIVYVLIVLR